MELSKSGVYFDTKNRKVVESQPEEGIQILAPGDEITEASKADVARWREAEDGAPTPPVAKAVTTDAAAPARKKG
jgi:hypothetical protein